MNATPNSNDDHQDDQRRQSDDDDDDDDDRKPPAKEIHVVTSSDRRNRQRRRNHDSSSNLTNDTASISSWTSPFAARLPSSESGMAEYTPSKKQNSEVPSLTALTPFSMRGRPRDQQLGTPLKNSKPQALGNIQVILSLWLSTVLLSVAFLAYILLPTMALSTLAFMMVSSTAFLQTLVSASRHLYEEAVVHGNGLGSLFLPESLNQLLTQTTMHEYLTGSDSSTMDDYQYLALYFLPLTQQQRDAALARLTPSHRNRLHQSGLGQWLMGPNSDPWRLLVGNRRYFHQQRQAIDIPGGPLETVIEAGIDHQQDDSSSSSLGLDITSDDLRGGGEQQGTAVARILALTEDSAPDDGHDQDENAIVPNSSDELDVLYDAIWTSAMSTVVTPFFQTVQQTMWPVVAVSSAMAGMAAGVTWMVRGNRRHSESSWMVVLGGGATVVMSMVGARYGLGAMMMLPPSENKQKKKDTTPRGPQK